MTALPGRSSVLGRHRSEAAELRLSVPACLPTASRPTASHGLGSPPRALPMPRAGLWAGDAEPDRPSKACSGRAVGCRHASMASPSPMCRAGHTASRRRSRGPDACRLTRRATRGAGVRRNSSPTASRRRSRGPDACRLTRRATRGAGVRRIRARRRAAGGAVGLKLVARPDERREDGRGDRIRTCDFSLPKRALYQAELRPGPTGDRTTRRSVGAGSGRIDRADLPGPGVVTEREAPTRSLDTGRVVADPGPVTQRAAARHQCLRPGDGSRAVGQGEPLLAHAREPLHQRVPIDRRKHCLGGARIEAADSRGVVVHRSEDRWRGTRDVGLPRCRAPHRRRRRACRADTRCLVGDPRSSRRGDRAGDRTGDRRLGLAIGAGGRSTVVCADKGGASGRPRSVDGSGVDAAASSAGLRGTGRSGTNLDVASRAASGRPTSATARPISIPATSRPARSAAPNHARSGPVIPMRRPVEGRTSCHPVVSRLAGDGCAGDGTPPAATARASPVAAVSSSAGASMSAPAAGRRQSGRPAASKGSSSTSMSSRSDGGTGHRKSPDCRRGVVIVLASSVARWSGLRLELRSSLGRQRSFGPTRAAGTIGRRTR